MAEDCVIKGWPGQSEGGTCRLLNLSEFQQQKETCGEGFDPCFPGLVGEVCAKANENFHQQCLELAKSPEEVAVGWRDQPWREEAIDIWIQFGEEKCEFFPDEADREMCLENYGGFGESFSLPSIIDQATDIFQSLEEIAPIVVSNGGSIVASVLSQLDGDQVRDNLLRAEGVEILPPTVNDESRRFIASENVDHAKAVGDCESWLEEGKETTLLAFAQYSNPWLLNFYQSLVVQQNVKNEKKLEFYCFLLGHFEANGEMELLMELLLNLPDGDAFCPDIK